MQYFLAGTHCVHQHVPIHRALLGSKAAIGMYFLSRAQASAHVFCLKRSISVGECRPPSKAVSQLLQRRSHLVRGRQVVANALQHRVGLWLLLKPGPGSRGNLLWQSPGSLQRSFAYCACGRTWTWVPVAGDLLTLLLHPSSSWGSIAPSSCGHISGRRCTGLHQHTALAPTCRHSSSAGFARGL